MSRSRKRVPISGITTAAWEKEDKRLANRKVRRAVRRVLQSDVVDVLPHCRELTNPWVMVKDGKRWFDADRFPELLRK